MQQLSNIQSTALTNNSNTINSNQNNNRSNDRTKDNENMIYYPSVSYQHQQQQIYLSHYHANHNTHINDLND